MYRCVGVISQIDRKDLAAAIYQSELTVLNRWQLVNDDSDEPYLHSFTADTICEIARSNLVMQYRIFVSVAESMQAECVEVEPDEDWRIRHSMACLLSELLEMVSVGNDPARAALNDRAEAFISCYFLPRLLLSIRRFRGPAKAVTG